MISKPCITDAFLLVEAQVDGISCLAQKLFITCTQINFQDNQTMSTKGMIFTNVHKIQEKLFICNMMIFGID